MTFVHCYVVKSRENKMVAVLLILGLLMHTCECIYNIMILICYICTWLDTVVQCQEDYNETIYLDGIPCFSVNLRLTATIYYQKVWYYSIHTYLLSHIP